MSSRTWCGIFNFNNGRNPNYGWDDRKKWTLL